jgi:F-type H+-transporting ATPase subunit b
MSIKWYQLLFQLINFGVLVFVLNRFLYRPILKIIELRNKKIQDSIKAAEETLKEKAKIEIIKKKVVEEAEKEAVKIVEQAKSQADKTSRKIIEAAKIQAEQEVNKKFQLMQEKLAEQEEKIKTGITDLVIKTTAQLLKDALTPTEQKSVIDKEIKKLSQALR